MHLQSIITPITSPVAEMGHKRLRLKEIRARQQQLMAEAPTNKGGDVIVAESGADVEGHRLRAIGCVEAIDAGQARL